MSFAAFLERVRGFRRELVFYAAEPDPELAAPFSERAVSIHHRRLPADTDEGFLVIRHDGEFVSSIGLDELREFVTPPIYRPWDESLASAEYRTLLEVLDNTLWYSLDRRQLLATSREIENRAWRVGRGALTVGFQRLPAFEEQIPVYERLAGETALDVHVYGHGDWETPTAPGVALHTDSGGELGDYWFLAFDGGGDDLQACALLARERDPDSFEGFWTYEPDLVDELQNYVRETYG